MNPNYWTVPNFLLGKSRNYAQLLFAINGMRTNSRGEEIREKDKASSVTRKKSPNIYKSFKNIKNFDTFTKIA